VLASAIASDQGRAQLEIELQMGREQCVVRILDTNRSPHQAGRQRVAQHLGLKMRTAASELAALQFLLALVLDPDLGFFTYIESR